MLISSLGYPIKTSTTFAAVMIGYFANLAIPRIGEITRCGIVSKKIKTPLNAIIGTVIAERVFDMIVLMIILLFTILLQLDFLGDFLYRICIAPLSERFSNNFNMIMFLILLTFVLCVVFYFLYRLFLPKLKKLNFYHKLIELTYGFITGIKSIRKVKDLKLFLLYTVFIWALYTLMVYIPFFALKGTTLLTFGDAITIMAIGSIGMVIPIPGGFGSYHFIVIAILTQVFQIAEDVSTSFAYLIHTSQTVMIIIVGALCYLILFIISKKFRI